MGGMQSGLVGREDSGRRFTEGSGCREGEGTSVGG